MSYPLGVAPEVHACRVRFFEGQGLRPERMVTFFTEHKDDITVLEAFPDGLDAMKGERLAVTDAVICKVPGTGVFLTFADCVPLVVYDAGQHIMAFAHVGWRSMALRFTGKVLRHLLEVEGSRVGDLHAYIGPCIKAESYLYRDPVQAGDPLWEPYLVRQPDGRVGIDLVGFCVAELDEVGVSRERVVVEAMDTAADAGQFSHYAATERGEDGKKGRLVCYGYLRE